LGLAAARPSKYRSSKSRAQFVLIEIKDLMIDLTHLIGHWGYLAIFVVIVLGNIGVPVPEEAVLVLAGLLIWKEKLWLPSFLSLEFSRQCSGTTLATGSAEDMGERRSTAMAKGSSSLLNG
jgi:hypothetical protein